MWRKIVPGRIYSQPPTQSYPGRPRLFIHWKLQRTVSAPECQLSPAEQSLILPLPEPFEHNYSQKSPIKAYSNPPWGSGCKNLFVCLLDWMVSRLINYMFNLLAFLENLLLIIYQNLVKVPACRNRHIKNKIIWQTNWFTANIKHILACI